MQLHPKTRVCIASPDNQENSESKNVLLNGNAYATGHTTQNETILPLQNTQEDNFSPPKVTLSKAEAGVQTRAIDKGNETSLTTTKTFDSDNVEDKDKNTTQGLSPVPTSQVEDSTSTNKAKTDKCGGQTLLSWISEDNPQPIECEEWLFFLQKTMEEVMDGEVDVMKQENFIAMLVSHLRNPHASSKVIEYVACLLSLPFVVNGVSDDALDRIKEVSLFRFCW